jgi:predicted MFS family arabinose efflux permease
MIEENPAAGCYPVAAAAFALMLAGTLLPTPLFEIYRRLWHLSPSQISLVFAVYVASLVPSLLFLGGLSDRFGRRFAMLLAFVILALGSLLLAFASGLVSLIVARVVQGIAMGIGTGAAAAAIREWMPERDRPNAGNVTVVAASAGSAFGVLLGAALAQYAPFPLSLAYFVHLALLACAAVAVAAVPAGPHPRAAHAPLGTLPVIARGIRRPFVIASVQAFIGWATFAIFIALVPAFLARSLDVHNLMVGALLVGGIQTGSAGASILGQRLPNRTAILAAMLTLSGGMWMLLAAVALHAYALIGLSSLVAGSGGGLSYLAGLNIVGTLAPAEHRAGTLSAFLIACYLGFSIPALGVGIAADRVGLFSALVGAAIVLGAIGAGILVLATDRNLQATACRSA